MSHLHFEKTDLRPYMETIDRHTRELMKAHHLYALPRRFVAGVPTGAGTHDLGGALDSRRIWHIPSEPAPMTLINRADCIAQLIEAGLIPNPKETAMIEKKNFVTPPVKTPAGSLAHRHLGSLVTITLPSGAEITDILVGVASGKLAGQVGIGVQNVTHNSFDYDFLLDPKSVVLVRRPRIVKVKAVKR